MRLAGRFAEAQVPELMQVCAVGGPISLDLTELVSTDTAGLEALSRIREGEEVSERVVMQQFALEALRTVNQLSTVAGLLGNLFAFNRLIERRLSARRGASKAATGATAEASTQRHRMDAATVAQAAEKLEPSLERRTTPDRRAQK